jgi:hypothetical protein
MKADEREAHQLHDTTLLLLNSPQQELPNIHVGRFNNAVFNTSGCHRLFSYVKTAEA